MRKYKCIQGYPGCKKDTIVRYHPGTYPEYWDEDTGKSYQQMIIEHYPKFWEEVKEKEYEILSLRMYGSYFTGGYAETTLRSNGLYLNDKDGNKEGLYTLEKSFENGFNIHSIKRLSDSEIFTIGDTVQHIKDNRDRGKIVKFDIYYLPDRKILVEFKGKNYHTEYTNDYIYSNSLEVLEHVKEKPLFTTEDGVDKYLGDECYQISILHNYHYAQPNKTTARKEILPIPSYFKYFSTKEKAQEHIGENKPKYSKKAISKALDNLFCPLLYKDKSVFGEAIKEGYKDALFKELNNDKT